MTQRHNAPKLLDVGCGDGSYAVSQEWHTSFEYVGVDIDGECVELAQQNGLTVSQQDVCEGLAYPDDHFDRVVAKAVLEHVADPLEAARECRRVLKPRRDFVAIVPSDRSYDEWGDYTHLRAFRKDALQDLLEDAGFSDVEIEPRMGWNSVGMAVKSVSRILAPWTPYGFPRAWEARARI